MWRARVESLDNSNSQRTSIQSGSSHLTFSEVAGLWQDNTRFRDFFISLLSMAPWPACFWETPPVTLRTFDRQFEFVLVESRALAAMQPDRTAFDAYFRSAGETEDVVAFGNLGGDALLVAPCPRAPSSAYPHLVAFSRLAPVWQQHALWRGVAKTLLSRLDDNPVWLSTSGLGVPWVHVRLDSRPKYYQFGQYRSDTGGI